MTKSAADWKAEGNTHLKAGAFDQAIACYTSAIEIDASNHVFFSNRSAAYASKKDFAKAKADGEQCIKLKPDWSRGYSRLALAQYNLKEYEAAIKTYQAGLKVDPQNAGLRQGMQAVVQDLQRQAQAAMGGMGGMGSMGGQYQQQQQQQQQAPQGAPAGAAQAAQLMAAFGPGMWSQLERNYEIRQWLENEADFKKKMKDVQKDPMGTLQKVMAMQMGQGSGFKDERVQKAVMYLIQESMRTAQQKEEVGMTDEQKMERAKKRAQEEMRMQEEIRKREMQEHEINRKYREKKKKEAALAKEKAKYDNMEEDQKAAHKLKDAGNEFFTKAQQREKEEREESKSGEGKGKGLASELYEQAIAKYTEAVNLYPNDVTFLSNRSAVYYKLKDFEKCLSDLEEAVKIADENSQDFNIMARVYGRMGHIHRRNGDMDKAIFYYDKSLTEKHTDSIYKIRKVTVKKRDKAKKEAYFDKDKALEAKERGNNFFREKKFRDAVKEYTEAIARDPGNSKFYSNRAAAYHKCAEFGPAMDDCLKAVDIDSTNVKAWGRMGDIHFFLKEYHKAQDCYNRGIEEGTKSGANISVCQQGLTKTSYAIQTGLYGARDEVRAKRGMADPEIQKIMSDPVIRKVLDEMSTDPKAMEKHMSNPGVAAKINRLIAAGVLQMGRK